MLTQDHDDNSGYKGASSMAKAEALASLAAIRADLEGRLTALAESVANRAAWNPKRQAELQSAFDSTLDVIGKELHTMRLCLTIVPEL